MRQLSVHQLFDLIIILALAALSAWYLWDSYTASIHIYNLIFVLPLTLLIIGLCIITFVRAVLNPEAKAQDVESISSVAPAIVLFVLYVLTLAWLGFDVGTFLFLFLFLRLHGEKRWSWAFAYSAVFAICVSLFFSYMLPYPMPMLLLPTEF